MMLYTKYMKALGLVVSDKILDNCLLKTYFLTPWPTYVTNWNGLNILERGPPRDHFCEVWSKSNERFQRRRCLSKKVDGRRTTTDDGQRPVTIAHPEHFVLRWAKNKLWKQNKINTMFFFSKWFIFEWVVFVTRWFIQHLCFQLNISSASVSGYSFLYLYISWNNT